jgi:hypothetical protein
MNGSAPGSGVRRGGYEEVAIHSGGVPIVLSIWHAEPQRATGVFLAGTMVHPLFYAEFLERDPTRHRVRQTEHRRGRQVVHLLTARPQRRCDGTALNKAVRCIQAKLPQLGGPRLSPCHSTSRRRVTAATMRASGRRPGLQIITARGHVRAVWQQERDRSPGGFDWRVTGRSVQAR